MGSVLRCLAVFSAAVAGMAFALNSPIAFVLTTLAGLIAYVLLGDYI